MTDITKFKIKSNYIRREDFLNIIINKESEKGKEVDLDKNFKLIFNEKGIPLYLNVYNASNIFKVSKFTLSHIKNIDMIIDVKEDFIKVKSVFTLTNRNKDNQHIFNFKVKNDKEIPSV